jgi:hypothetical protein
MKSNGGLERTELSGEIEMLILGKMLIREDQDSAARSAGSIFLDKSISPTSAANVGVTGTTVMVMDDVLPARPLIVVHYGWPAGSAQLLFQTRGVGSHELAERTVLAPKDAISAPACSAAGSL